MTTDNCACGAALLSTRGCAGSGGGGAAKGLVPSVERRSDVGLGGRSDSRSENVYQPR